jgi:membrane associated rhomboid family serine protease
VRNLATIFAAKGVRRIWSPVMILQVIWIVVFLLYVLITFVGLALRPGGGVGVWASAR